jgi:hypothetical protein
VFSLGHTCRSRFEPCNLATCVRCERAAQFKQGTRWDMLPSFRVVVCGRVCRSSWLFLLLLCGTTQRANGPDHKHSTRYNSASNSVVTGTSCEQARSGGQVGPLLWTLQVVQHLAGTRPSKVLAPLKTYRLRHPAASCCWRLASRFKICCSRHHAQLPGPATALLASRRAAPLSSVWGRGALQHQAPCSAAAAAHQ